MRIKKYIARNLKEGKATILKDLGDDAVILSSRASKKPETGEEFVEIVAAIDEKPTIKRADIVPLLEKRITTLPVHREEIPAKSSPEFSDTAVKILAELADIKYAVRDVQDSVKYRFSASLGEVLGKVYKKLMEAELTEETALEITGKLSAEGLDKDFHKAMIRAREIAVESLTIIPPLQKTDKRRIAVFIGSTGSGKTSALVKIAVVNKLMYGADILIVSADTYKVGGAEQLQTFASIAGISYRSVYNPSELAEIVDNEKQRDLIFVDTTGKSHNNRQHILELGDCIKYSKADLIYLVQSAALGVRTFSKIIEAVGTLNPTAIALTKLDEAEAVGGIVSAMKNYKIPLAYFTAGQQIPDDIEPASKKKLGELLLPDKFFDLK